MAYPQTIRERIVLKVIDILKQARDSQPAEDLLFNKVKRGSMEKVSNLEVPCCAVDEGPEEVVDLTYPHYDKALTLYIHFRNRRGLGNDIDVSAYSVFNYYLGEIHRNVCADRTLDGLCHDVQEIANNIEIEGPADPQPGGVLIVSIKYRHKNADPFVGVYGNQ